MYSGQRRQNARQDCRTTSLFHPDCTVGTGISPVQSLSSRESRAFTAGREFHPALRDFMYLVQI